MRQGYFILTPNIVESVLQNGDRHRVVEIDNLEVPPRTCPEGTFVNLIEKGGHPPLTPPSAAYTNPASGLGWRQRQGMHSTDEACRLSARSGASTDWWDGSRWRGSDAGSVDVTAREIAPRREPSGFAYEMDQMRNNGHDRGASLGQRRSCSTHTRRCSSDQQHPSGMRFDKRMLPPQGAGFDGDLALIGKPCSGT